jgi:hypothetical protein
VRVVVGVMLLRCSGVGAVKEDVAIFIIKRELPPIQGTVSSRLKEWSKHPVGCRRLQNRMNNQCS